MTTHSSPPPAPRQLKHILVPFDFSEGARLALQHAREQASASQATLTLLHVVHLPFRGVSLGLGEPHGMEGLLQAEASQQLLPLAEELKSQDIAAQAVVRLGHPGPEIVELARQKSVDLVIMGTQGRTGIKHALLGSIAEYVVRHAPCPVLVVRPPRHDSP